FVVRMPALRERRQDIPLLVEHFLKVLSRRPGGVEFTIARDALMRLVEFSWPGNVAQLRSVLEQSVLTAAHGRIAVVDLPPEIREITAPNRETPRRRGPSDPTAQREELVEALRTTNGNRAAAARLLGVSRVTMWKRLRKYGLK
ncbi:MAG TPA: helix-turn-helix domain-containing protein, partial [Pirellulaceae bacterium]|nr:helix-turn-helix domain-containing protein [Pirellulaceae bacterium]